MAMATQIQRPTRNDSAVFRRLELDRVLRALTEQELRELDASGALADLLVDEPPESDLEY